MKNLAQYLAHSTISASVVILLLLSLGKPNKNLCKFWKLSKLREEIYKNVNCLHNLLKFFLMHTVKLVALFKNGAESYSRLFSILETANFPLDQADQKMEM